MGAKLNRHNSNQAYQTPPEFLTAVYRKFGINGFQLDAAADANNSIAPTHYDEQSNGLLQPWYNITWCNPPFANIAPWVEKAWIESEQGVTSFLLVPASVGANWWKNWVHDKAYVMFLNGRITFGGQTDPYPKDCALLIYRTATSGGYNVWSWMQ